MPPLRVAVLGYDHPHTPDHLAAIAAENDAEVCRDLGRADAVVICSTTAEHPRLVRSALRSGLPTLIEKPLANSVTAVAELAKMIGLAPATTAMFLRCAPAVRRTRSLLDAGTLGEIVSAELLFSHSGLPDRVFDGRAAWMLDPAQGGTGAVADLGIHLIDLLLWLRPDAPITVHGSHLRRRPDVAVDVGGAVLLDWDRASVTLRVGWDCRPGRFTVHLEGTQGSLTLHDGVLIGPDGDIEYHSRPSAGAVTTAFLAQLRGETPWQPPTVEEMLTCASILDRVAHCAAR